MKKLIILSILFVLCLPFQASALGPMMLLSGTSVEEAVDACATCPNVTAGADEHCEDFDETGVLCTGVTSSIGADNTWDADNTHGGTYACTDKGLYDLQVIWDYDVDSADSWHNYALATPSAHIFLRVDVMFETFTMDDGDWYDIVTLEDSAEEGYVASLLIEKSGENYYLHVKYRNEATASTHQTGSQTIALNTWYTVTLEYYSNTPNSILKVTQSTIGGSPVTTIDISGSILLATSITHVIVGSTSTNTYNEDADDGGSFELDRLLIDDDTMPTACPN